MAFFNTRMAALLLSLSAALCSATDYSAIARAPSTSPAPSPSDQAMIDTLNSYTISKEEQASDSQYLKAHMTAAANKVEGFVSDEVEKRLVDPNTSDSERKCLLVCKDVYQSAVDSMKTGTESVSSGDFVKANFDLSAFSTNIDTCDDCFDEFKEFDGWAKGVGGNCLDKIVKYNNL